MNLPLDAIVIGDRHRKEMGDLRALADSIAAHGLLHPVVVTSDHRLVAGHRRMEAVRLLGWSDVPVTVVDPDDLLSAEYDENTVRKDFEPTEATAIGRLLEETLQERAKQRQREHGHTAPGRPANTPDQVTEVFAGLVTREVVGRAVGMSGPTYQRAKAVAVAAEEDPEKYGDLPEMMDNTGSVKGTFDELNRRRNGHTDRHADRPKRHPMLRGTRHIDPNRVVQATVDGARDLMAGQDLYDYPAVDPARIPGWVSSLEESIRFLTTLKRNLNKELTRVQQ